jgi:hypothetical protein
MTRWLLTACLAGCCAVAPVVGQEPTVLPEKLPEAKAVDGEKLPEPIPGEKLPEPKPKEALPPAPPCGPMIEKTVSVPRAVLVPEEQAIVVPKLRIYETEIGRDRLPIALDFREERSCITEMVLKPRVEEQQVCTTKLVEETCLDCHGHPHKVIKQVPEVVTIKVTKYDVVPQKRDVIVRVPVLKPGPEVRIKRLEVHEYSVGAIERRYHAVFTPNEVQVQIPAPVCPAPCADGMCPAIAK